MSLSTDSSIGYRGSLPSSRAALCVSNIFMVIYYNAFRSGGARERKRPRPRSLRPAMPQLPRASISERDFRMADHVLFLCTRHRRVIAIL